MWVARTKEKTVTYATARQKPTTSARDVKNGFARNVTHCARPNPMSRTVIDIMRETSRAHVETRTDELARPTCRARVT